MDWESPVDAWYIWVGVSIVSVVLAGFALALPSGVPPDANQAANTIDQVTGSPHDLSGTYDHDADEIKVDKRTIALRNDEGTNRATLMHENVISVQGNEDLMSLVHGESFEDVYGGDSSRNVEDFIKDVDDVETTNSGQWNATTGTLAVRTIRVDAYWYDQWSSDEREETEITVEVSETYGGENLIDEITVEYEVHEETDISLELSNDPDADLDIGDKDTTIDGTGKLVINTTSRHMYPNELEVEIDGDQDEYEFHDEDDTHTLLSNVNRPDAATVADHFSWLNHGSERFGSGEFYVTLVAA